MRLRLFLLLRERFASVSLELDDLLSRSLGRRHNKVKHSIIGRRSLLVQPSHQKHLMLVHLSVLYLL